MAVDGKAVYWTTRDGKVRKWDKSSHAVTQLAAGKRGVSELVVDASQVYWFDEADKALMRMDKNGGTPVRVTPAERVSDVTADARYLYWCDDKSILRVDKMGGEPKVLATDQQWPEQLIVDDKAMLWVSGRQLKKDVMRLAR